VLVDSGSDPCLAGHTSARTCTEKTKGPRQFKMFRSGARNSTACSSSYIRQRIATVAAELLIKNGFVYWACDATVPSNKNVRLLSAYPERNLSAVARAPRLCYRMRDFSELSTAAMSKTPGVHSQC